MVCPSVSAIRDSQSRHPAATRALRLEARQQSPYNLPRGEMGMRPILIVITHAWRASSWTECPSAGLQALPFWGRPFACKGTARNSLCSNQLSDRSMSARRVIASDCALIVGAWLAFLVILAMLQWLGQGVGFDVWPMGEDRLGVWAIQQPSAGSAASLTWQQLDDRNPLSPWWYVLFRTLILDLDCGLLLLRYAVGLGLALISYAFVVSVGGLRSRPFALGLGIVVALFMANGYTEQVYWDREIALICSLASVTLYAGFVGSGRQDYPCYAFSLVLWFLAFTTYTVQCGAILAVAYLAFTRRAGNGNCPLRCKRRLLIRCPTRCCLSSTYSFGALLRCGQKPMCFIPTSGNCFYRCATVCGTTICRAGL